MASIKLIVVSGPNRGATYFLEDGENSVGRAAENQIVLASTQVSKKHFAIVCQNNRAEIRDLGSSNGTFVNGVLTKKKLLQNHDRISAGPFVMEALIPEAAPRPDLSHFNNAGAAGGTVPPIAIDPGQFKIEEEPKGLFAKYKKKFDNVFLPVLYDFYERTEFANLLAGMFGVYVLINLGFTVYPVLQRSREEVLRQAEHQAQYISAQLAFLNRQAIVEGKEGALITEFAESEVYVKDAIVANLEGRIMAPGRMLNESFNNPQFLRYKDNLQKSNALWGKTHKIRLIDKEEIVAFTPIMVMSPTKGISVPVAVATVIYSTANIALDSGTIGTVYLEALFWSGLLGIVFLYLLYSVSHKPLEHLTDEMDKVLKGEGHAVEKKYRNEVIDQLIDTINSALGRIPRSDASPGQDEPAGGDQERMIIDNMMRSMEFLSMKAAHAMLMLDPELRVKMINGKFEELTGIRDAQGEVIDTVSRDESFPALLKEMVEKSLNAGNEGVQEDYDFASGTHKIHAVAIAGIPGRPESYLFLFEKQGD